MYRFFTVKKLSAQIMRIENKVKVMDFNATMAHAMGATGSCGIIT